MSGLRIVLVVLLVAVGVAVALPLLLRALARQMTYPAPSVPVPVPTAPVEEIELRAGAAGDRPVIAWWRAAGAADAPIALFFHGNGENLETLRRSGLFDRFAELGISVLALDYPGYGRSAGRPAEAANVAAGRAALGWARERAAGRAPVVAIGWSLGAGVALEVAAAAAPGAVDGVIALSAWTSLPDVAAVHFPGPLVRLLLRERYDNVAAAARTTVPVLVVHGARDSIIPAGQGRALASAFASPARFEEIAGAGHNDLLARPEVWRAMSEFVDALSSPAAIEEGTRRTLERQR